MPFFLSLASFANGLCWTVYALLRFDLFILVMIIFLYAWSLKVATGICSESRFSFNDRQSEHTIGRIIACSIWSDSNSTVVFRFPMESGHFSGWPSWSYTRHTTSRPKSRQLQEESREQSASPKWLSMEITLRKLWMAIIPLMMFGSRDGLAPQPCIYWWLHLVPEIGLSVLAEYHSPMVF